MNIIQTMKAPELFARFFGKSFAAWFACLKGIFGLPMTADELAIFRKHTQRETAPTKQAREAWLVIGRRGGKSRIAALVAVYLALFRDYTGVLAPGEVATIAIIAADRKQARTILRYINGFLDAVPMLRAKVKNSTKESIEFDCRVSIEIHTASFRLTRGYTLAAVIADEIAFWRSEDSANPDVEVIAGLRPGMASIPNALLLCISSPYSKRGALWEAYRRHFGREGDVLVWQAATRDMNPKISEAVVADAFEQDFARAAAEFGGAFRSDLEGYVTSEVLEAARMIGRRELPRIEGVKYVGFVDPSGGGRDSFTLAIAHAEGKRVVLDCLREKKPPFSHDAVTAEFAAVLTSYGVRRVRGDRYGGTNPGERFGEGDRGIEYTTSDLVRSDLYAALLPLLTSGRVELLDSPKLIAQLASLQRRTGRSGRDSIDHAPGAHDDLANSAAGALVYAHKASIKPALVAPQGIGYRPNPFAVGGSTNWN